MIPAGMFGLHVRFGDRFTEPTADFTCRCGYSSSAQGVAAVIRFVETAAAAHRQKCPLRRADGGGQGGRVDGIRAGHGDDRRVGGRKPAAGGRVA